MTDMDRTIDVNQLYVDLLDPKVPITRNNYHTIEDVVFIRDYTDIPKTVKDAMVYNLLVRLRNESPHVFAITVGQFPGFENIEDYWRDYGFVDSNGYQWFMPRASARSFPR